MIMMPELACRLRTRATLPDDRHRLQPTGASRQRTPKAFHAAAPGIASFSTMSGPAAPWLPRVDELRESSEDAAPPAQPGNQLTM
jgi:hypothetical protein